LGGIVERLGKNWKIFVCCCCVTATRHTSGEGRVWPFFFLPDDYLFAVHWQGHPTGPGLGQPALLYVDLHDALHTGKHNWRKIDYPKGSIAITQAFSVEEDNLVVSVLR
jgi:hypothetical protein